ncbi:MAG: pentapeptide repeat-containing protein [SAR202 cluster bacterium]|nr:pentapeptide repeat-containing protein [SAR202 cluster bacterium]
MVQLAAEIFALPASAASSAQATKGACCWRPADAGMECTLPLSSGHPSLCILHNPDEDKDVADFDRAIQAKIDADEAAAQTPQIDLCGVIFPPGCQPLRRIFNKAVNFAGARFLAEADFRYARFGADVDFRNVRFGGHTDFAYARFGGQALFWGVEFAEDSAFGGAGFHQDANFASAQFSGNADFQGARFEQDVDFSRVRVEKALDFRHIAFAPHNDDAAMLFQDMVLEDAQAVRFEDVDLSRVSFLRTDVSEVRFVGCTWGHRPESLLWPLPFRRLKHLSQLRVVLYDEMELETSQQMDQAVRERRLVADLYRQFRLNLENHRQEAEAGHFYVGQMEMRRRDPSYSWLYRGMLSVYRVLAMYGESYLRPPLFYMFFGLITSVLYVQGGFETADGIAQMNLFSLTWAEVPAYGKIFVQALAAALSATGLFGGELTTIAWWLPIIRYANMMLDTFLLGFFVVAVGRHFKR